MIKNVRIFHTLYYTYETIMVYVPLPGFFRSKIRILTLLRSHQPSTIMREFLTATFRLRLRIADSRIHRRVVLLGN